MAHAVKRPEAIQDILVRACARNELLILATPFLRFESFFVATGEGELQVAATMSREDATYGLRSDQLRIRFPMGLGFLEAPVQLLGLGVHEGRRTLRLAMPKVLQENDHRAEYRVERVGRVLVTCGTLRGELMQGALVDLNTRGARLHAQQDLAGTSLRVGAELILTIPLSEQIKFDVKATIRHMSARTLGLEFAPPLPEAVQEPLSRWVFRRREEDLERNAQREEVGLRTARQSAGGEPALGILLVSGQPDLEEPLRETLKPIQSLTRIGLSIQALRDALLRSPVLAIFQVDGASLDQRRRIKALVEAAAGKVPVLLLGQQIEPAALFELAGEWKAASALVWNPDRAAFLLRLAQGIIRQHTHSGAAPLAPSEG